MSTKYLSSHVGLLRPFPGFIVESSVNRLPLTNHGYHYGVHTHAVYITVQMTKDCHTALQESKIKSFDRNCDPGVLGTSILFFVTKLMLIAL